MPRTRTFNSPDAHAGPAVATLEAWCEGRRKTRPGPAEAEAGPEMPGDTSAAAVDDLASSLREACCRSPPSADAAGCEYWTRMDARERLRDAQRTVQEYVPARVASFTIRWANVNKYDPKDVLTLSSTLLQPADTPPPAFRPPQLPLVLNSKLPPKSFRYGPLSLVPMLVAAETAAEKRRRGAPQTESRTRSANGGEAGGGSGDGGGPVWTRVDIVTQRGNLNKVALDDQWWAVGAQKIGGVLFLRRYVDRPGVDVNFIGFQFERACCPPRLGKPSGVEASAAPPAGYHRPPRPTSRSDLGDPTDRDPDFSSFLFVTIGKIGRFQILLESEIDAVCAPPQDLTPSSNPSSLLSRSALEEDPSQIPVDALLAVELKCTAKRPKAPERKRHWLQSRLSGVDLIVYGYRSSVSSDVVDGMDAISPGDIAVAEDAKAALFAKIEQALEFLVENVPDDGRVYVFRREKVEGAPAERNGKTSQVKVLRRISDEHAFVSEEMLNTVQEVCRNAAV